MPSFPVQPHQISRNPHGSHHPRGGGHGAHTFRGQQQQTHWYEPGRHRCTHEQCAFTGSKKSVEIHMMDRHLIYPPGWDKRKRKRDWDADPSLDNGKPIPIQGTSIILNTPETVDAWIAERRNRWPSASRVEDKEKKLRDAIERGEITATDPKLRNRRRLRTNDAGSGQAQMRGMGRGGSGRGRAPAVRTLPVHSLPMKPVVKSPVEAESSDEDASSGSDVDPEKDAVSSKIPLGAIGIELEKNEPVTADRDIDKSSNAASPRPLKAIARKLAAHPGPPASQRNPFATCSSLLRNLLLPEIRMTVSNLSQAIHFLVENDFLQDVELNPGDADNKPIEVISETTHENA
ncbi:uncharacterized protein FOMMEDRAFT_121243 [Fomitiporia mediterranea MF3/22]|uniref:uncharacterized protein n=1 Tax=Fomitiporia mediterranea (strain MF3/22) TaxID=694068 RepID=UPI00044081EB|nr:uncharacterized protein FOMMEDRAFT_121243 [Fomitiporia mediterranea MF3/22]EJD03901.1 hypothetical protein FOMMEDRAFT_121243 [Fomitiporia mediterranea MF3/22]